MRLTLLSLSALLSGGLLSGCGLIMDLDDGSECERRADCPVPMQCDVDRGRCVPEGTFPAEDLGLINPDGQVGADAMWDATLDATLDAGPDALVDASSDMDPPDEGLLRPDAGLEPFGPEGECFDDAEGLLARAPAGSTIIPSAGCTPEVLAWVVESEEQPALQLWWQAGPEAEIQEGPTLPRGATVVVDDAVVLTEAVRPEAQVQNIQRIRLTDPPAVDFLSPSARRQAQPTRRQGLTAFLEEIPLPGGDVEQRVILADDSGARRDCGQPGRVQWGVALAEEGVAWFERPVGQQRVDLVLTRGPQCGVRAAFSLQGLVTADARLVADQGRFLWPRLDPATRQRELWMLDLARLVAGPAPVRVEGLTSEGSIIDMALKGDWLALTTYAPGGPRLSLYHFGDRRLVPMRAAGSARRPTLSGTYVLWSGQQGAAPWEIRYARLPE